MNQAIRPTYVWADLWGEPELVGAASCSEGRGLFAYAPGHLEASRPALDPCNLPLQAGEFTTRANAGVFGVLADAGPDAWGRRVLAVLHPKRMASPTPLDVLALASGHGTGSLMFSASRDSVKARPRPASVADLEAAVCAIDAVEHGRQVDETLRAMLSFGSSLGGMKPKVAIVDRDVERIAKFRSAQDAFDTPRLEVAALNLARIAGINAVHAEHRMVGGRSCVLVDRFDRLPIGNQHYVSAHSLWNRASMRLEADALTWASYGGIVELGVRHMSSAPKTDAEELFRRMVFNVVIGNTDDHGRNHGFTMTKDGVWALSPAFDISPTLSSPGGQQALGIGCDGRARTLDNALSEPARFGLSKRSAVSILGEVVEAVSDHYASVMERAGVLESEASAAVERALLPDGLAVRVLPKRGEGGQNSTQAQGLR